MWVAVTDLPDAVRATLAAVSYGRSDIEVRVTTTAVMSHGGSQGTRAFTAMVNLDSGEREIVRGSWGGANMFAPTNPVDRDGTEYPLPANGVIVMGSEGYPRTFAALYVSPALMPRMIAAPPAELSPVERDALWCHVGIRGGQYRRDELRRRKVQPGTVDALVARGLLKANRAGAVQVTTDGRNALGDYRGF
jgi:hypothetical protein